MASFEPFSERTKRRRLKTVVENAFQTRVMPNSDVPIGSVHQPGHTDIYASAVPAVSLPAESVDVHIPVEPNIAQSVLCVAPSVSKLPEVPDEVFEQIANALNYGVTEDKGNTCVSEASDNEEEVLRHDLASWAASYNITQVALGNLLGILRLQGLDLPKDPRTLLKTGPIEPLQSAAGGEYCYIGVSHSMEPIIRKMLANGGVSGDTLTVNINIDGIPLFSSVNASLWPILMSVNEFSSVPPFPVALFYGRSKPSSIADFTKDFIPEMLQLEAGGVCVDGAAFRVAIGAVICDAPARAFVKCIKGHNAYHSCERCVQQGKWMKKITFPEFHSSARTDDDFRQQTETRHHTGLSPLCQLSLGMVTQFPLDYMHLVCLGVVKRLVLLWTIGPQARRLSSSILGRISQQLVALKAWLPREFGRRPRSLSDVRLWKATEFRTFLLYTGPVVLKGLLDTDVYLNFLCLSVAVSIYLSPELCSTHVDYAEQLMETFVRRFAQLYTENQLVYNVHGLLHLADDVRRYGALDSVSAFPFESALGRLKAMVRKPHNPLAQIVHRLKETGLYGAERSQRAITACRKPHNDGPVPAHMDSYEQYRQYECGSLFITSEIGNNCIEADNGIALIENIMRDPATAETYVVVRKFEEITSFFHRPLNSDDINIFNVRHPSAGNAVFKVTEIVRKYILLPTDVGYAAFPFLHAHHVAS